MKLSILALLCGSAAAFAPATTNSGSAVVAKAAMDDLEAIAAKSNPVLKVGFCLSLLLFLCCCYQVFEFQRLSYY